MTTVTDGSTRQVASTQNRNGPDLQCACCYHTAPRDQPVYLASFVSSIWTWHRPVCADCWDKGRATKPDNPLHSSITAICRDYRGEAYSANFRQLIGGGVQPPMPCGWCHRPVVKGGRATSVMCSDRCRVYAYRERRRQERIDYPDLCHGCEAPMPGSRRNRRYCSDACRQKAYRDRVNARAAKRAADAEMMRTYDDALLGGRHRP